MDSFSYYTMDNYKLITVAACYLCLSACTVQMQSDDLAVPEGFIRYENLEYSYSIDVPAEIFTAPRPNSGPAIGFSNYSNLKYPLPEEAYSVSIQALSPPTNCNNLGIASPQILEDGSKVGKIDFFDQFKGGENPDPDLIPLCRPTPSGGKHGSAYALCTQKNNKEALVCVSQVNDNPRVANQVLNTFRWTD